MKKHYGVVLIMVFGLLGGAAPLFAHHAIASEFDPIKEWSVNGVLSELNWTNPHAVVWVDSKDPVTGKVEHIGCESHPPAGLHRIGLNKADWKIGEEVTMTCNAAKDGNPHWGFLKMIKYKSDGHVMVFRLGGE